MSNVAAISDEEGWRKMLLECNFNAHRIFVKKYFYEWNLFWGIANSHGVENSMRTTLRFCFLLYSMTIEARVTEQGLRNGSSGIVQTLKRSWLSKKQAYWLNSYLIPWTCQSWSFCTFYLVPWTVFSPLVLQRKPTCILGCKSSFSGNFLLGYHDSFLYLSQYIKLCLSDTWCDLLQWFNYLFLHC